MAAMNKNFIFQILIFLGMLILLFIFWNTIFVFPLKIFVVLLHELGHGLAAILTGGHLSKIIIQPDQSGETWSSGGWRIIVLPAGYLGSMLFGGIILVTAARSKKDKIISMVIGVLIILISLLFVRNLFGFIFGIAFGTVLVLVGFFAPMIVNDFILKFIGLTSILYAVFDIKDDLISRTVTGSDAYQMSKIIPLPPVVWGVIWIIIALVAAVFFLRLSLKGEQEKSENRVP